MSWNWQKIDVDNKNIPEFDSVVLLYQNKNGKHLCSVGKLEYLDKDGCHWRFATNENNVQDIFRGIFNVPLTANNVFEPTHWCVIEIP